MKILGIDPGIGATGFAILEGEPLALVSSGEIRPAKEMSRLKYLFTEIGGIIDLHQPEVVALEDTFFAKNVKSALTLGDRKSVV